MKKLTAFFAFVAMLGLSASLFAETAPVMLSLVDPIQFPDNNVEVTGVRLNLIYGRSRSMTGATLGLANRTDREHIGGAFGFVHMNEDIFTGAQAGLLGFTRGNLTGADLSMVSICQRHVLGGQAGFVTMNDSLKGVQFGFLNFSKQIEGAQLGFVNLTHDIRGFQLGLFNYTKSMYGLQIGILNVIQDSDIPYMVIANAKF